MLKLTNAGQLTIDAFGLNRLGGHSTFNTGLSNIGGASTAHIGLSAGHAFDDSGGIVNIGAGSVRGATSVIATRRC